MLLTRQEQTFDVAGARFEGGDDGLGSGPAVRPGPQSLRSKPDPLTETYLRDPTVRRRLSDDAVRVR